jgi:hypothetical protein
MRFMYFIILILLTGCSSPEPKKPRSIAVVLCDVSNSVTRRDSKTTADLTRLKDYAKFIPSALSKPFEIYYLMVSNNLNEPCITGTPLKRWSANQHSSGLQEADNREKLAVLEKALDDKAKIVQNSCLLTSIYRGHNLLKEMAGGDTTVSLHLFILSDLIESCDESLNGRIIMLPEDEAVMRRLDSAIVQMKLPFSFENSGVTITVCNTSPDMKAREHERLQRIWSALFGKMKIDPRQLRFYSQVPVGKRL